MRFGLQRSRRQVVSVLLAFTFAVAPIIPAVADEEVEPAAVIESEEVESVAVGESEEAEFEAAHGEGCQGYVWIDLPAAGSSLTTPTSLIAGWALDANETFAAGVELIEIRDGQNGPILATTGIGVIRTDVDLHWGRTDLRAGWQTLIDWFRLSPGTHNIVVRGRTHCGWTEASLTVNIAAPPPAPPTSISINDVSGTVGDFGDRDFNFNVTLSQASSQTVTVQYRTEDGSAGSGDYSPTSGTLTFSPGETSQSIRVRVFGRRFSDFDRELTFFVRLSNPTNATIADGEGVGRIRSSSFGDGFGDIFVSSASCAEGSVCTFTLSRSGSTTGSFSVSISTRNGTATGGSSCFSGIDYIEVFRTEFFSSGEFSRQVSITTCTDSSSEGSETFFLRASGREGTGTITDGAGGGTITITATTGSCAENTNCVFQVTQSGGSAPATVNWSASGGTAIGAAACGGLTDFAPNSGSVSVPAGGSNTINILACANGQVDAGQTFTVTLNSTSSGSIGSPNTAGGTVLT